MQIQKISFIISFTCMLFTSIFFLGCEPADEYLTPASDVEDQDILISSELIGSYSAKDINKRFENFSILFTKHDIKVYRIVYKTKDESGNIMNASGAVIVPQTSQNLPLLSLQHGTITKDQDAPSYYRPSSEAYYSASILASNGYIVSAPDYIGYGASNNRPHLYEHASSLGSASFDMLRATRMFCEQNDISFTSQTFLAGYSEGGYATMALHKLMEEKYPGEFDITASAPAAGAYDKTSFAKHIMSQDKNLSFMNTYLWVLETYKNVYDLDHTWEYYLQNPYAEAVNRNGIFTSINGNPKQLFNASFIEAVKNDSDKDFSDALADNDIYDWKPEAKMTLYHGTDDDFVPIFNSINAYNAMKNNGAEQVKMTRFQGKNHTTGVLEYSIHVILWFNSLKTGA